MKSSDRGDRDCANISPHTVLNLGQKGLFIYDNFPEAESTFVCPCGYRKIFTSSIRSPGPPWATKNLHFPQEDELGHPWVAKKSSLPQVLGKSWGSEDFSLSAGLQADLLGAQEGQLGAPWITKNLHFLMKVSWDPCGKGKIFLAKVEKTPKCWQCWQYSDVDMLTMSTILTLISM